jgi:hypothetical protein
VTHDRPIRVVFFGGAYLQPGAQRFVAMLEANPEIDLVLGICEGPGSGLRYRLANLWRRRGLFAIPVLLADIADEFMAFLRQPRSWLALRRHLSHARPKIRCAADVHAQYVLDQLRAAVPDLGVIYGGPILRPAAFEIPSGRPLRPCGWWRTSARPRDRAPRAQSLRTSRGRAHGRGRGRPRRSAWRGSLRGAPQA